jgi:hypothetical protein
LEDTLERKVLYPLSGPPVIPRYILVIYGLLQAICTSRIQIGFHASLPMARSKISLRAYRVVAITRRIIPFPEFHDIPAQDIRLVGRNYKYQNVLGNVLQTVHSGAFVPFGVATTPGQVVEGSTKCSGSILRCNPDGRPRLTAPSWRL